MTAPAPFQVRLEVFEGPFDLLLQLIGRHQLDVTEVALSQVTDDVVAHLRAAGPEWVLGQATEVLGVAATLLDGKAARLLPGTELEDEEDRALLEARDLLFARLLQYRGYEQAAAHLAGPMAAESRRHPPVGSLEPAFAGLLPEVLLGLGPAEFAALAARVLARPADRGRAGRDVVRHHLPHHCAAARRARPAVAGGPAVPGAPAARGGRPRGRLEPDVRATP